MSEISRNNLHLDTRVKYLEFMGNENVYCENPKTRAQKSQIEKNWNNFGIIKFKNKNKRLRNK